MKVRTGFVSNSSSTSFCVPSSLLTDEQKEMLLSIDDMKDTKAQLKKLCCGPDSKYDPCNSENDYPVNEDYHRIYEAMIENDEWDDSGWETSEDKELNTISGSTGMWNGTIEKFMEKIGIDPTAVEIANHGHAMIHMATHPEAVKHMIWLNEQYKKRWVELPEEDQKFNKEYGIHPPADKTPYEISDDEFSPLGENSIEYETDAFTFVKDKKNED